MLEEAGIDYGIVLSACRQAAAGCGGRRKHWHSAGQKHRGRARAFLRYCAEDEVMDAFCRKTGVLPTKRRLGKL